MLSPWPVEAHPSYALPLTTRTAAAMDQFVRKGVSYQFGIAAQAEFSEHSLAIGRDGFRAQITILGDLGEGLAL